VSAWSSGVQASLRQGAFRSQQEPACATVRILLSRFRKRRHVNLLAWDFTLQRRSIFCRTVEVRSCCRTLKLGGTAWLATDRIYREPWKMAVRCCPLPFDETAYLKNSCGGETVGGGHGTRGAIVCRRRPGKRPPTARVRACRRSGHYANSLAAVNWASGGYRPK
jgi:hypothetical protein